jgi:hypothetical protein
VTRVCYWTDTYFVLLSSSCFCVFIQKRFDGRSPKYVTLGLITIEQEVLERINLPTFLTLFTSKLNCLQRYDIAQNYRILHKSGSAFVPTYSQIFTPSSYLKASSNKRMIHIERTGMSVILYCTKLHLSRFNASRVFSIKDKIKLSFSRLPRWYFWFSKKLSYKSCSWFEDLPAYKIAWSHVD